MIRVFGTKNLEDDYLTEEEVQPAWEPGQCAVQKMDSDGEQPAQKRRRKAK
jgi:hypothetical protein